MRITVRYSAQVKAAAKTAAQVVEVPDQAKVADAVRQAASEGSDELKNLLLSQDGALRTSLLLFVGDDRVAQPDQHALQDGDTIVIMSPISGG